MSTMGASDPGFVSPRSRRLRTVGLILLIAAVGMTLYGSLSLMPGLKRAIKREAHVSAALSGGRPLASLDPTVRAKVVRARRAAAVQVTFAYSYWAVCALLVAVLIVVAWLDVREVQRRYVDQRIRLFAETAQALTRDRIDKSN